MTMKDSMKRVKGPSDVPQGHHYAVLVYKTNSVYVPGDERSRTNPGHGYPGGTEYFDTFEHWVTEDKDDLTNFVRVQQHLKAKFVFFEIQKLGKLEIKVDVNP